jgi:hypothetical protein
MTGQERREELFEGQIDRLSQLAWRAINVKKMAIREFAIIAIEVDDPDWRPLADALMPDNEAQWQKLREQGMTPIARGIIPRETVKLIVDRVPDLKIILRRQPRYGTAYVIVLAAGGASAYEVSHNIEDN